MLATQNLPGTLRIACNMASTFIRPPRRAAMSQVQAVAPTIPPFWQRLNKFFLFPLHPEAMLYAAGLAACSYLFFVPLINIFVGLALFLAVSRYAFKIAALASFGIFTIQDYTPRDEEEDWKYLPWKFVGASFVQALVVGWVVKILPGLDEVGQLLLSLLIPATLMVLIKTSSFAATLNPAELWRTVRGVGWSYLLLCLFLFLLMQGSAFAAGALFVVIPRWLLLPGLTLVVIYFTWVMAAMIGYTMYQYHHALDIDVVEEYVGEDAAPANPREVARRRDAEVAQYVQQGELKDALSLALDWVRESPDNLAEHRRYHRVLLLADSPDTLERHGRDFIELLLKKHSASEALQVYKACAHKVPGFVPQTAPTTLLLAQHAYKGQDSMLALQLLRGFDKRFPGNHLIPAAYALIVRVLVQGLHRPQQALAVYQGLQRLYPADPHTLEAGQILKDHAPAGQSPTAA